MKIYRIILIGLLFSCQSEKDKILSSAPEKQIVHICISKNSERYHYDERCIGFNNCTHEIRSVTITEAEQLGYTECRIEK